MVKMFKKCAKSIVDAMIVNMYLFIVINAIVYLKHEITLFEVIQSRLKYIFLITYKLLVN